MFNEHRSKFFLIALKVDDISDVDKHKPNYISIHVHDYTYQKNYPPELRAKKVEITRQKGKITR